MAITAALRGAGGYGKTTMARAICHNERIQEAFDDGILWVTLGENPGSLLGKSPTLSYAASISNGKEPDSSGGVQVQRVDLQCRIVGIVERDPGPFPAGGGSPVSGVMIPLAIARMIDAEAVTTAQSLLRDPLLPRSYGSLTVRAKHAQFTQDVDGDGFLDIFNKSLSSDGDIRR